MSCSGNLARGRMKKVTLIVPDKIEHVVGSSRRTRSKFEDVTPNNLIKALCDRSHYHEYYYFESPDEVKVISIVDCGE
jgi:hypothetical protein